MPIPDRLQYRHQHDPRDYTADLYGWGNRAGAEFPHESGLEPPYGRYRFWDGYVARIFNRPLEPGENPFPTHASLRASRAFEGGLRIIPLEYLADAELPALTGEEAAKANLSRPISVRVALTGPPVVPNKLDAATVLRARLHQLYEIAVLPFYV